MPAGVLPKTERPAPRQGTRQTSDNACAATNQGRTIPSQNLNHASAAPAAGGTITVSIVSHGHDEWLARLLPALAATGADAIAHVIVTHNLVDGSIPQSPPGGWPFRLTHVHNEAQTGFGTNHNRAFSRADTDLFCVLNPDMTLTDPRLWNTMAALAAEPGVGCAYPTLLNPDGSVQDNARAVPTPWALMRRRLLGRQDLRVDWASASFWVVPSTVFRSLKGFDERFYMYCEDTDFCLRLQLAGWRLARSSATAIHHAQRSSLRPGRHFLWHLRSLWRLWTSEASRAYLRGRKTLPVNR
jgi:GT2 family glycosyltransferase